MILTESFQFTKSFEVGSFQVKPEGNIRLSCLADLFQEIAWAHADSADFGRNLSEINLMWALARLEIEILEFPKWGDSIRLFTGSKGADKLFAFRDFMVADQNDRILVRGMSSWLLLDTSTKRIQKAESVLPAALYDPNMKPDHQPQKLVAKGEVVARELVRVRFSDLDLNYHVNNTSYIRWVENFLADRKIFPSEIAINYQAESFGGDQVELRLYEGSSKSFVEGRIGERLVFIVAF